MASNQAMELVVENEEFYPATPTAEFTKVVPLCVLAVFELEIAIDDSQIVGLLGKLFLPINPRFSSLLLRDEKGSLQWKRVQVRVEDHVHVPHFPAGLEPSAYDEYLKEYLSKVAMERLPENRPLWEFHMFKYPTSDAEGVMIFKLHHALGDGFSLMGALFSCLKRSDDPSLPLTLPCSSSAKECSRGYGVMKIWSRVSRAVSVSWNTACDFSRSVLKLEDDRSAIRSGRSGIELLPFSISFLTISLSDIRQVRSKTAGTVNDVAVGTIFYGIHLYKQKTCQNAKGTRMTAVVLLNTRMVRGYQSIEDMKRKNTWGNHLSFILVPVPSADENGDADKPNPLSFILRARETIKKKRDSLAVFLNAKFLQIIRSFRGPEAVARFLHSTMKNASIGITNMIGPVEKMEMAGHPVKSFYFTVAGTPNSVGVSMVSYMESLRMVIKGENGFVDSQLLASCMKEAFHNIYTEACGKDGGSIPP